MRPRSDYRSRVVRTAAVAALLAIASGRSSSVVVAQSAPPLTPFRGLIDHVTTTIWGGVAGGSSDSNVHSISGDGRHVVFSSGASDLVPNDYNWLDDVFLRDRMTGVTTRVSVAANGGDADGISQGTAISTNGRHVAFASGATNLVAGDSNSHWDVFVRDLDANRTVRVSVATDSAQGDADSYSPSVSADGRYVAFISASTTFASGIQQYGPTQIYLHDRDADGNGVYDDAGGTTTSLVSVGIDRRTGGPVLRASARQRRRPLRDVRERREQSPCRRQRERPESPLRARPPERADESHRSRRHRRSVVVGHQLAGVRHVGRRPLHHLLVGVAGHRALRHELAVAGVFVRCGRRSGIGHDDRQPPERRNAGQRLELLHRGQRRRTVRRRS